MRTWKVIADLLGPYYVIFITFVGHSTFFLICITAAWTSPVLTKLSEPDDNPLRRIITPEEVDLIGSIFFAGAALGPFLAIYSVEKYGRKLVLVGVSIILPVTYAILTFAETIELYYICRVLQGIYSGAALSIEPVFLSEILPSDEREFLMSIVTIFSLTGILTAYALGPFLPLFYFNTLITLLSFSLVLLSAFGFPQSPYHVMKVKGKTETRELLKELRYENVEDELNEIEKIVKSEVRESYLEIFKSFSNLKSFISCTVLLVLQQFSGITLLTTYSQLIFSETHITIPSEYCSIIVSTLQVSTAFLAPLLMKSEKFSQKSLLIFCFLGLGLSNLLLGLYFLFADDISGLSWVPLVGLTCFVIIYNCGIDPIPWIILGEGYPKNINTVGSALSTSVYFLSVFPLLYLFTKVNLSYLFIGSFLNCVLGILYSSVYFSENEVTKL